MLFLSPQVPQFHLTRLPPSDFFFLCWSLRPLSLFAALYIPRSLPSIIKVASFFLPDQRELERSASETLMPSSASSTTLERTSSVPTLTDASPSPSSNSSRSSVLAELAIDADPHTHPDVITGPPSSIEEASQRATAQLNVARHLLSSARLYVNKADALRAVKSFGDILASLLGLRPSPHCDTSPYLQPSVVAHVSKLLSSDLYSWFMSSNDSIGAHSSLADPLVGRLTKNYFREFSRNLSFTLQLTN